MSACMARMAVSTSCCDASICLTPASSEAIRAPPLSSMANPGGLSGGAVKVFAGSPGGSLATDCMRDPKLRGESFGAVEFGGADSAGGNGNDFIPLLLQGRFFRGG